MRKNKKVEEPVYDFELKTKLSDFIYIKKDELSSDFCSSVIKKFKKDKRKSIGRTNGGLDLDVKKSTDLNISSFEDWKSEDDLLFNSLSNNLNEYFKLFNFCPISDDTGYQIQETKPGEFYHWHHDFSVDTEKGRVRTLTYIWYLNDVEDGGYTEFIDGTRIYPETGKFVLFPATWMYRHRGVSPVKKTKYICTGWVWA